MTFKIVSSKMVPAPSAYAKRKARALLAHRKELLQELATLETACQQLVDKVLAAQPKLHGVTAISSELDSDGNVTTTYCECLSCQAALNQVSHKIALAHFVQLGLIPPGDVEAAQAAEELDARDSSEYVH